ncbi:hypothetical protein FIBSPDRAFT_892619 [Athelia psychrophila]|uniref:Uncharacterized protein n=1 Tax=Athelia psychrophila TaxID=1759441 RepID=A0A166I0Y5_9AGAM|nr:hypothetical protein FIBSPDRAFT_892619 [Fibularhizoctonia sp. CBS 109695]
MPMSLSGKRSRAVRRGKEERLLPLHRERHARQALLELAPPLPHQGAADAEAELVARHPALRLLARGLRRHLDAAQQEHAELLQRVDPLGPAPKRQKLQGIVALLRQAELVRALEEPAPEHQPRGHLTDGVLRVIELRPAPLRRQLLQARAQELARELAPRVGAPAELPGLRGLAQEGARLGRVAVAHMSNELLTYLRLSCCNYRGRRKCRTAYTL